MINLNPTNSKYNWEGNHNSRKFKIGFKNYIETSNGNIGFINNNRNRLNGTAQFSKLENYNSTVPYKVTHNNEAELNIPEIMEIPKTNLWSGKQNMSNAIKSNKTIEERKYLTRVSPEESHAKALYQRNQINKGGKRRTVRKNRSRK